MSDKNPCGNDKCNGINSGIDKCIAPLVKALNSAGLTTVASCCGHGNTLGNIALDDGREIIIAPDFETGRRIEKGFPDIHGTLKEDKNTFVHIEWTDSAMHRGWQDDNSSFGIAKCFTVGVLVEETEEAVMVAQSGSVDDKSCPYADVLAIPKCNITSRVEMSKQ